MAHLIAPSVLVADFANIQRDFEMINRSNADWFHIDAMDGVFVEYFIWNAGYICYENMLKSL